MWQPWASATMRRWGVEVLVGVSFRSISHRRHLCHLQSELGDVVFVELPEVGKAVKQGETFGVVESVKVKPAWPMPTKLTTFSALTIKCAWCAISAGC
jgi:hypothetical protein